MTTHFQCEENQVTGFPEPELELEFEEEVDVLLLLDEVVVPVVDFTLQ